MSLFQEFKRRNVFRAAIAYLALAWLLTEVAGTVLPGFGVPDWAFRFVVIVLALGFVPVLIFSWAYEITPEGVKREKDVVRDESITHLTARRLDVLTIALVILAVGVLLADRLWLGQRMAPVPAVVSEPTHEPPVQSADESSAPLNSIAVLPFANRSDRPDDVFFVDGIHDDLLTYIAQIGSIKTISRTSVMKYRDSTQSIPDIASELGVATVLEGGVQRAGDQVRINVQLIDAKTDDHLWSQIYDRQLTAANVFAIQSEIATAIAEALRAELTPEAQQRFESTPTENLEALEAYFFGQQSMATRTISDLARAVEYFETSIAEDPEFALAHTGLALASALYANYAGLTGEERRSWLDKSQAAADRALQLNPGLSEAYTASGLIKWYERDFEAAELLFKKAMQLNPNDVQAHQWLGMLLSGSPNRVEEALGYSLRAVALDPKSAIILADNGDVLRAAGRHEEALTQYQQAVAVEPRFSKGHRRIGQTLAGMSVMDEAIPAFHKALEIEPGNWVISRDLGTVYFNLGDDEQAEYWFQNALELAPSGQQQLGIGLARIHMIRGEPNRAREYLDGVLSEQPDQWVALYFRVNIDLAEGDTATALARYQSAYPGLLTQDPNDAIGNHVSAIHLATVLSRAGETEAMNQLLDRTWQEVDAFEPRHLSDDAAIHMLRGDEQAALDALGQMEYIERFQSWSDLVMAHPAFDPLRTKPEFQAMNKAYEDHMADQLRRVQAMESQ